MFILSPLLIKYAYIMNTVIAFMLLWIGDNTDYNVNLPHPKIVLLSQTELEQQYGHDHGPGGGKIKGFYSTKHDTIYIPADFNIHDPWKKSVLFHELYHYVQDQNEFQGKCVQEWEREVYPLQKKYMLEVHGLSWDYDPKWYDMVSTCPKN